MHTIKRILPAGLLWLNVLFLAACGQAANALSPTVTPGSPIETAPAGNKAGEPVVTPDFQQVTLSNDGQKITLGVGQSILLNLGADYEWTVTVADQNVLSREVNVLVIKGAQGIYKADQAGNTDLTASGDPLCMQSTPPCMSPSRIFHIQVVVNR